MTIDEPGYFERLARVESGHWWSRAMWRLASDWLGGAIQGRRGLWALDVGCGAGLSLVRLAGHREVARVVGLEPDAGALRLARRHHGFKVVSGSALALPFENESFDIVTCFDVFQHLPDGGDRLASGEIARVLRVGGVVVARSNSAYRPRLLTDLLTGAGLHVRRASYANGLPSLLQEAKGRLRFLAGTRGRSWRGHPSGGGLRLDVPLPFVNGLMGGVAEFERRASKLLGKGLPFGHSTMILAEKRGGNIS